MFACRIVEVFAINLQVLHVYSSNFDIIGVTETWLNNAISDNEILPGFSIYHFDRCTRDGGILLAIKHLIPSLKLPSPTNCNLELVLIQIGLVNPIRICLLYS